MARPVGKRRADAALQLRVAGTGFDDIATTLGYKNGNYVRGLIERALADNVDEETRDLQRELAGRRLERLLRSVWPKANDPSHPEHLPAVREARALIDRHIRLYGLDQMPDVIIHTPGDDELLRWVSEVLSYTATKVEEANVVDAEVVDADE